MFAVDCHGAENMRLIKNYKCYIENTEQVSRGLIKYCSLLDFSKLFYKTALCCRVVFTKFGN